MKSFIQPEGWYSDITLEGDRVSLIRNSHIDVNDKRIELPGENVLFLVCKRWNGQLVLSGQGHVTGVCWVYKNNKWDDIGITFDVYPCAFNSDLLYFVSGINQYRIYELETGKVSNPINRLIGSQGIRYIDFNQSPDGIVTGDSTYGPAPYDLSQWINRENLTLGQSYDIGGLGYLNNKYYKFIDGSCEFIRYYKSGNNLAFCSVNQPANFSSFYWMTLEEFQNTFPIVSNEVPPIELPEKPPIEKPEIPVEPKKPEPKPPVEKPHMVTPPEYLRQYNLPSLDDWLHVELPQLRDAFQKHQPPGTPTPDDWYAFQSYRRYAQPDVWTFDKMLRHELGDDSNSAPEVKPNPQ